MSENEQAKQPTEAEQVAKDAAEATGSAAKEKAPVKKKEENKVVRLLEKIRLE